jgi:hypothetical protein
MIESLRGRGESRLAVHALRWIIEELTRTPMEFGESRNYLSQLGLHVRVGFAGPCGVVYAVSVEHHMVFIRHWATGKR